MKKNKIAIILGIVCFIITIAIFIQIKTIESSSKEIGGITITDKSNLRDELLNSQSKYKTLYTQLEKLEKNLEKVRQDTTSDNSINKEMEENLNNNKLLLGLTKVEGEGITIKVDDNREIQEGSNISASQYIVHEQDIIQIINELFNAGADAISINGNRIVSTTSILCDGVILRINGELVGVPITIKAIGYPERLYYALIRPQGYLDIMKQDGVVVEVEKSKNIKIPKYDGIYSYENIN